MSRGSITKKAFTTDWSEHGGNSKEMLESLLDRMAPDSWQDTISAFLSARFCMDDEIECKCRFSENKDCSVYIQAYFSSVEPDPSQWQAIATDVIQFVRSLVLGGVFSITYIEVIATMFVPSDDIEHPIRKD